MEVFVVLPVFNEEKALTPLLLRFVALAQRAPLQLGLVVVNDGSSDHALKSRPYSALLPIDVFQHDTNRGLGQTIRDGLTRAAYTAGPEDIVVTMDADNSHPHELILEMVERLRDGNDVVIASRYRKSAQVVGVSRVRRLMSHCERLVFELVASIPNVRDYTCGFRAYRVGPLRRVLDQFDDQDTPKQSWWNGPNWHGIVLASPLL